VLGAGLAVGGVALVIGGLLLVSGGGTPSSSSSAVDASAARPRSSSPAPSRPAAASTGRPNGTTAARPTATAPAGPTTVSGALPGTAPAPASVRPQPAGPSTAPRATSAPRPALVVLNNSRVRGLAARTAVRVEQAGWPVRLVGSYRGRIRATTVYYPAGLQPAAARFATSFPGVARVLPRPATMPGPPGLVLVVTRDAAS
jgi:hypothetical protein